MTRNNNVQKNCPTGGEDFNIGANIYSNIPSKLIIHGPVFPLCGLYHREQCEAKQKSKSPWYG